MPVLVTAADQPLARRLVTRLLAEGGEVRAYGSGDLSSVRAAGAVVATGTWDDEGRLDAALTDVHTAIHLGGGLLSRDPDQVVAAARVLAAAATNAGVRRLVALSLPGAGPAAADPLRRAKGRVEAVLAAAAPPSIVVRTSLVDTPALRDVLATAGVGPDVMQAEVAPVRVTDLVDLLLAFDRARSRADAGHLVVSADGPVRMPVSAFLDRVGVAPPGRGGLVGRRLGDQRQMPLLHSALAVGPWWTEDPVVVDGWSFAGLQPRPPAPE